MRNRHWRPEGERGDKKEEERREGDEEDDSDDGMFCTAACIHYVTRP
jgi:ribosomal protein L12E/L44/L45/RPP1/RPP2